LKTIESLCNCISILSEIILEQYSIIKLLEADDDTTKYLKDKYDRAIGLFYDSIGEEKNK